MLHFLSESLLQRQENVIYHLPSWCTCTSCMNFIVSITVRNGLIFCSSHFFDSQTRADAAWKWIGVIVTAIFTNFVNIDLVVVRVRCMYFVISITFCKDLVWLTIRDISRPPAWGFISRHCELRLRRVEVPRNYCGRFTSCSIGVRGPGATVQWDNKWREKLCFKLGPYN